MNNIRWVIQNNLINEKDLKALHLATKNNGCELEPVDVHPFLKILPKFTIDEKINIYYGSTTFMQNIYNLLDKPVGLFYDENTYSMENYISKWGKYMLSSEALITTIGRFIKYGSTLYEYDGEINVFVRPDGDSKSFDGNVYTVNKFKALFKRQLKYDNNITEETKILVGPAYNIVKEWRNYVVGGEIVTSSKYRQNFKLSKSATDIPETMLKFTNDRIKEYSPHENVAIDIAQMDDGSYYIIECGCLNSVGFYNADINQYVKKITEWAINKNNYGNN